MPNCENSKRTAHRSPVAPPHTLRSQTHPPPPSVWSSSCVPAHARAMMQLLRCSRSMVTPSLVLQSPAVRPSPAPSNRPRNESHEWPARGRACAGGNGRCHRHLQRGGVGARMDGRSSAFTSRGRPMEEERRRGARRRSWMAHLSRRRRWTSPSGPWRSRPHQRPSGPWRP